MRLVENKIKGGSNVELWYERNQKLGSLVVEDVGAQKLKYNGAETIKGSNSKLPWFSKQGCLSFKYERVDGVYLLL